MKPINRIKVVLVEKQKTGKWLAEQLGKDQQPFQDGALTQFNRLSKHSLR